MFTQSRPYSVLTPDLKYSGIELEKELEITDLKTGTN